MQKTREEYIQIANRGDVSAFMALYTSRTPEVKKADEAFLTAYRERLAAGVNFDNEPFWTPSKKRGTSNKMAKKQAQRDLYSVPEEVYMTAILGGHKMFLKMLLSLGIPASDWTRSQLTGDLSGYDSAIHRLMATGCQMSKRGADSLS